MVSKENVHYSVCCCLQSAVGINSYVLELVAYYLVRRGNSCALLHGVPKMMVYFSIALDFKQKHKTDDFLES